MPRPVKQRLVCEMPQNCHFGPLDKNPSEIINMTVDEYETIRLIDLEGLTQEECSKQMNVARTTVQGIYIDARKKLAEVLVNGKKLVIGGGEYKICGLGCRKGCRFRWNKKENDVMKIAIPVDEKRVNSEVCMSYGRTPFFAVYNTDTKEYEFLDNSAAASSGGAGIKASQMLVDNGVTTVITQRLGQNAADVLNIANVDILLAVAGDLQANVDAFLEGKLNKLTNIHPGFHGKN